MHYASAGLPFDRQRDAGVQTHTKHGGLRNLCMKLCLAAVLLSHDAKQPVVMQAGRTFLHQQLDLGFLQPTCPRGAV